MGKLGSSTTEKLKRRRRKEVKPTSPAVERCGVKPRGKVMESINARQQRTQRAQEEVRRVSDGRLTDRQIEHFAQVFAIEELCFQYFEDEQYQWAARHLRRQGHADLASLLEQHFVER